MNEQCSHSKEYWNIKQSKKLTTFIAQTKQVDAGASAAVTSLDKLAGLQNEIMVF